MARRFVSTPPSAAPSKTKKSPAFEQDRHLCDIGSSLRRAGSLLLLLMAASLILPQLLMSQDTVNAHNGHTQIASSTSFVDPDIVDSEWNHHLAGYILIGIALLVLSSRRSPKLGFVQALWPFLFIGAGLFLAAWSDKEIWPRGFLSWTWLIHHDAEARQHKIYAILLLAMGVIEYLRWRGKLSRFWRTWAFPFLALLGACLLLVHDHGGNSGLPPGWDAAEKAARIAKMAASAGRGSTPAHAMGPSPGPEHTMAMPDGRHEMADMKSSAVALGGNASSTAPPQPTYHKGHEGHVMTSSMLLVKREHLWFTLVGIAVAIFKFLEDGSFWGKRFVGYLYPGTMCVLGVLLALYKE